MVRRAIPAVLALIACGSHGLLVVLIYRLPDDAALGTWLAVVGGSVLTGLCAITAIGNVLLRRPGRTGGQRASRIIAECGDLVEAVRRRWLSAALDTTPADRMRTEAAITELYRLQGLPAPRFVWTGSPVSGALAVGLLSGGVILTPTTTLGEALDDPRWAVIGEPIRDSVRASLVAAYGDELDFNSALRNQLAGSTGQRTRSLRWDELDRMARRGPRVPVDYPTVTLPWFVSPYPGQLPGEWMDWSGGPPVGEFLAPVTGLPGWLQAAVDGDTGIDPEQIAQHQLWRRMGLVSYGEASDLLDLLVAITHSCGWWWPYPRVCVLSDRPATLAVEWVDGQPRPHDADGPAIEYRDGLTRYAWHGVLVPGKVITGEVTGTDWLYEGNVEVRRAIAERMGYAWLLERCAATKIAVDEYGTLWRLPHPVEGTIALVDVVNSTPEPDGSFRRYVLRVPPDQTVPRDAIGWTFGLPPGAYGPTVMT
jgi:hypothetical protein